MFFACLTQIDCQKAYFFGPSWHFGLTVTAIVTIHNNQAKESWQSHQKHVDTVIGACKRDETRSERGSEASDFAYYASDEINLTLASQRTRTHAAALSMGPCLYMWGKCYLKVAPWQNITGHPSTAGRRRASAMGNRPLSLRSNWRE